MAERSLPGSLRSLAAAVVVLTFAACSSGGDAGNATATATAAASTATTSRWVPTLADTIQVQYAGPIDTTVAASVYDLDAFETPASLVSALHGAGRRVLCYVNAGAYETYRSDAAQFPQVALGKAYAGYPQERWLDIRRIDLLAPVMTARLDRCASAGFDGVDPDNVNGYQNDTGFPLTAADQLAYDRWLAAESHARGLAVGLKNDDDQVPDLVASFDFAVTEECSHPNACAAFAPFVRAKKPAFTIEYTDQQTPATFRSGVCPPARAAGYFALLKHRNLDAYRETCG